MVFESTELYLINNKSKTENVFYIVFNEWKNEYYIATKKEELPNLTLKQSQEIYSHTYCNLVCNLVDGLVYQFATKKDGSRYKNNRRIEVMGKRKVPILFKDSLDAALYIDQNLKEYTSQCGGLTPIRSGKFQIIGY